MRATLNGTEVNVQAAFNGRNIVLAEQDGTVHRFNLFGAGASVNGSTMTITNGSDKLVLTEVPSRSYIAKVVDRIRKPATRPTVGINLGGGAVLTRNTAPRTATPCRAGCR